MLLQHLKANKCYYILLLFIEMSIFEQSVKMKRIPYLILLLLVCHGVVAQLSNIGSPFITKFTQNSFKAGPENFTAVQNSRGNMFFGNGMGVLAFDGTTWDLIEVDNRSYVRSLAIDNNDKLFVGAYQEFGYLTINKTGNYKYKSLTHLIPNTDLNIADIWKIIIIDDHVFFQSYYAIFEYCNDTIKIHKPKNEFVFAFNISDQLYVGEKGIGLLKFNGSNFELAKDGDFYADKEIRCIIELPDEDLLIGTRENGIYKQSKDVITTWNTNLNTELIHYKLNCGLQLDAKRFVFGTVQTGLFICNLNGAITDRISIEEGLQDNDIIDVFADRDQNLWVTTNQGIAYAEVSSGYSILASGIGTGYASLVKDNIIYLGTNRGLFYINNVNDSKSTLNQAQLLPNTVGQVWNISEIQDHVLIGHHEGAFLIKDNEAIQISTLNGHWNFIQLNDHPDYVLSGTYTGYALFKIIGKDLKFVRKVNGFNESCRISYQDSEGYIWMSHGYKGIYKLKLDSKLESFKEIAFFDNSSGLPSNLYNDIFLKDGNIYITAKDGIYQFNYENQQIELNTNLSRCFNFSRNLSKVIMGPDGSIWNFSKGNAGKLTIINDSIFFNDFQALSFIEDQMVSPFENISWDKQGNMIIGTQNGFVNAYAPNGKKQASNFRTEISNFEAIGETSNISFKGNIFTSEHSDKGISIPYSNNIIRVAVSANYYGNSLSNQFRYTLSNVQTEWTTWSKNNIIEFPHLKEGTYELTVESRNHNQVNGIPIKATFTIESPWHRTVWAYLAYVLLFIAFVGSIVYFVSKRFKHLKEVMEQQKLAELEQKEKKNKEEQEKAEQELMKLKNEKLSTEVVLKSKELANTTQGIIHKNQVLNEIKDDLKLMAEESKNVFVQRKIKGLLRKVDKDIDNDRSHEIFRDSFDRVHENFISRIKKVHTDLTPKDLRLCSYLRMNLSTKEIAPMLNISVRGVEISRYRLRKKLALDHDKNLTEYLMNF